MSSSSRRRLCSSFATIDQHTLHSFPLHCVLFLLFLESWQTESAALPRVVLMASLPSQWNLWNPRKETRSLKGPSPSLLHFQPPRSDHRILITETRRQILQNLQNVTWMVKFTHLQPCSSVVTYNTYVTLSPKLHTSNFWKYSDKNNPNIFLDICSCPLSAMFVYNKILFKCDGFCTVPHGSVEFFEHEINILSSLLSWFDLVRPVSVVPS